MGNGHIRAARKAEQITESDNATAKSKQFIATLAYHYINTPICESVGRVTPLAFLS